MTTPSKDAWVGPMTLLVPADIRHQFRGELMAERVDMRDRGWKPWRVNLATATAIFVGVAQHVPLTHENSDPALQPDVADRAALAGWIFWRVCGPLLFLSDTLGSGWLALFGVASLAASFLGVGAVAARGREPYDRVEVRLINGLFGGLAAVFAFALLTGGFFLTLLLLGVLIGSAGLSAFAIQALIFLVLLFGGMICLAGWVPREWEPQRMVRH